jgi:hypothetical protein
MEERGPTTKKPIGRASQTMKPAKQRFSREQQSVKGGRSETWKTTNDRATCRPMIMPRVGHVRMSRVRRGKGEGVDKQQPALVGGDMILPLGDLHTAQVYICEGLRCVDFGPHPLPCLACLIHDHLLMIKVRAPHVYCMMSLFAF